MTTSEGWQTSQCNVVTDVEIDDYIMAKLSIFFLSTCYQSLAYPN